MKSLEKKVVTGLSVMLIVAFGIILSVSFFAVKSLNESYVLTRLEHDAEALLSALGKNPQGRTRIREGKVTPIYQQPYSGHYYRFEFSDGFQINSRSSWDESYQTQSLSTGSVRSYIVEGPNQQKLLVRSAGYEKAGLTFTLSVAEDIDPQAQNIRYFQMIIFIVLVFTALIIILGQRYLLRSSFHELDDVRKDISLIASGDKQQLSEMGPDEIRPVTEEINRLLIQVQQRLKRSRDALGNLAHALKTPLSLMTHEIDNLHVKQSEKKQLSVNLEKVRGLIERELKRARLAGKDVGRYFKPSTDIPDLIYAMGQLHPAIKIETGNLFEKPLRLDHEDMLELCGNLLDNACKWAVTKVNVNVELGSKDILFNISDDGPGVDEHHIEKMTSRGVRIDENKEGSGLGLAIVQDIVTDYAGSIEYKKSRTLGGLQVSVRLPFDSR